MPRQTAGVLSRPVARQGRAGRWCHVSDTPPPARCRAEQRGVAPRSPAGSGRKPAAAPLPKARGEGAGQSHLAGPEARSVCTAPGKAQTAGSPPRLGQHRGGQ